MLDKILVLLLLTAVDSKVSGTFYNEKATGWHNYEDREYDWKKKKEEEQKAIQKSASELLDDIQKDQKEKFAKAYLSPTEENVLDYIKVENKALVSSADFAVAKHVVTLKNPEYDFTTKFPTDQYAREIYYKDDNSNKAMAIADLKNDFGLFYFYMASCGHCHKFSPVVKGFADKYGWHVQAISLDGGPNNEFPNAIVDNGQYEQIVRNPNRSVPVLIAFDAKNKKLFPIAYHAISESEIEENILTLINHNKKTMESHNE